jgi:cation transport ATPase
MMQAPSSTTAPDGVRVLVGNRRLMAEHSVVVPRDAVEYVRRQEGDGATCMLVAGGDR